MISPLLIRLSRCTEESVFSSRELLVTHEETWDAEKIMEHQLHCQSALMSGRVHVCHKLISSLSPNESRVRIGYFPLTSCRVTERIKQMLSRTVVTIFFFFLEWGRGTFWWYFVLIKWIMLKLWPETKQTNKWFGIMLFKFLKQISSSCAWEKRF